MNKVQTDNSYLLEKIILRETEVTNFKSLLVLDCYAGDGKIWNKIIERTGKEIKILRIDQKNDKKGIYLKGDNVKFIKTIDIHKFDIIDLDAYGTPYKLLKEILRRNYNGIIFVTFIQTGMGNLPKGMLLDLGYTQSMLSKIQTLFTKDGSEKLKNWLSINGIKKIKIIQKDRKTYLSINMKDQ